MKFATYPRETGVWIDVPEDQLVVVERALSGMTWLLHLPGWAASVPVYDPEGLIRDYCESRASMVQISEGRWVRAEKVAAVFFPNPRRDVVRLQFDRVRQHFDVFPGETPLIDQYEELRAMFAAATINSLPPFEELQAAA